MSHQNTTLTSFQNQTPPTPFGACVICNAIEPRDNIQWCTKCLRPNHRACTVALGRSGGLTSNFCDRCLIPGARGGSGGNDQHGGGGGGGGNDHQNGGQDGEDKAQGQSNTKQNEAHVNGNAQGDGVHVNGS
ncbi:hypothetical protein PMZ80_008230 [Knufia obscura]|uniref:Uncharacterized protein n=1 Tax=Knufia obscura TaxID=1635080 RepID=A0ABR0RI47_9EURO|nr:hypothetical protein PMZ80_008230 [Knufia obscura]